MTVANVLTGSRILCSIAMLFFPTFTAPFNILYLIAGSTDIADGIVARCTKTSSKFGAGFDTVADLVLIVVSLIKFVPRVEIPTWIWIWAGAIALVKITTFVVACFRRKEFFVLHSVLNKITGVLLFILPYSILFYLFENCAFVVCVVASVAAIHEAIIAARAKPSSDAARAKSSSDAASTKSSSDAASTKSSSDNVD